MEKTKAYLESFIILANALKFNVEEPLQMAMDRVFHYLYPDVHPWEMFEMTLKYVCQNGCEATFTEESSLIKHETEECPILQLAMAVRGESRQASSGQNDDWRTDFIKALK